MRILTANEIRRVEEECFKAYYNEAQLMKRAGDACYNAIINEYGDKLKNASISVFCGNGKNAGDGFVIAKNLYCYGANVKIVLCDKEPAIKEPVEYYNDAIATGVSVEKFNEKSADVDYIIDTIFGIGFHGEASSPFDNVFKCINNSKATVISVDTPSGTNATTGEICENAIKADFTVAISTLKYCHILPPANALCGKTVVEDIGIPQECYTEKYASSIEKADVCASFPKLDFNANKGSNGKLLNISGSYNMPGAAVISTLSAIRSGVGLVNLVVPAPAYPLVASHLVQNVFTPVENENKTLCEASFDEIDDILGNYSSILFGCGIGNTEDTQAFAKKLLKNVNSPIIIDADGINSLISCIDILKDVKVPVVLTPHPGEMARLTSKTVEEIQSNRIHYAREFAKEHNAIVVLKGANTVVTDGDSVFVNTTGNSGMAMAGTGDMLAGMISAFVAMGISPLESAKAGAYIHGLAGDMAVLNYSIRGITVLDMIDQLGALMSEF